MVYGINQDGSLGEERRVEHHQEPNGRMSHIHASMPTPDGNILRLRIAVLIIYIFMMQKRIKKFSSGKHRKTVDPDNSVSVWMENIYIWYLN